MKTDITNSQVWGCILSLVEVTKGKDASPYKYRKEKTIHGKIKRTI